MIYHRVECETFDALFFNKTNPEWERVRQLCLQDETNWLRKNYLPENLIIEEHDMFFIRYKKHTNEPVLFAGIYNNDRYPAEVGRILNRMYTFKQFRNFNNHEFTGTVLKEAEEFFIPTCLELSPIKRKLLFLSMQLRTRKNNMIDARWFEGVKSMYLNNSYNWQMADNLIRVANCNKPECYQLVIYKELDDYKFSDWNPKTITREKFVEKFLKTS